MLCKRLSLRQIKRQYPLGEHGETLLRQAVTDLGLSSHAPDKIRRIACTVANLAGEGHIDPDHMAEAIQRRGPDRRLWEHAPSKTLFCAMSTNAWTRFGPSHGLFAWSDPISASLPWC